MCDIVLPDSMSPFDVVLDVARRVPVARLDLVLLGVEIFLLSWNGRVLEQLKPVVHAVTARQRSRECHARLENPGFSGLQMERKDVRRVDEEVRAKIFP